MTLRDPQMHRSEMAAVCFSIVLGLIVAGWAAEVAFHLLG